MLTHISWSTMAGVAVNPAAYEAEQIRLFGEKVQPRLARLQGAALSYMICFIATVQEEGTHKRAQKVLHPCDKSKIVVLGNHTAYKSEKKQGGHGEKTTMSHFIEYKLYGLKKCVMVVLGPGKDFFQSKINASSSENLWKRALNDCMAQLHLETAYYASLCCMEGGALYLFVQSLENAGTLFKQSLTSTVCGKRKDREAAEEAAEEAKEPTETEIDVPVYKRYPKEKQPKCPSNNPRQSENGKEAEIETLREEIETLREEIEDLRCLLAEKKDAYDFLTRQYAAIRKRLSEYVKKHCTEENVRRELELIHVKQRCEDLEQEILLLKKGDDNKGDDNEEGDDEEQFQDKEIMEKFQDQISRKEEEAANDKKQICKLREMCKAYLKKAKENLEKAGIKDIELKTLRVQIEKFEAENKAFRAQVEGLNAQLTQKGQEHEALCEDVRASKAEVEDLKAKLGNCETQLSEKDKELHKKTGELSRIEETSEANGKKLQEEITACIERRVEQGVRKRETCLKVEVERLYKELDRAIDKAYSDLEKKANQLKEDSAPAQDSAPAHFHPDNVEIPFSTPLNDDVQLGDLSKLLEI